MDIQKLTNIIQLYKRYFPEINREEIYKWRAVKVFQDNWDNDALDFAEMLERSLKGAGNLLASGYYYPKRMIVNYAFHAPKEIRQLFKNLFDNNVDLFRRINEFQTKIEEINENYYPGRNSYQDERAIMVYLCLMYPGRYFFYKFEMFKRFITLVDHDIIVKRGYASNLANYLEICHQIKEFVQHDPVLLNLHANRIRNREYPENEYHILTQDIIYAAVRHIDRFHQDDEQPSIINRLIRKTIITTPRDIQPSLEGNLTDHEENNREREWLGRTGEELVLEYEREITKNYNVAGEVIHASKVYGDGLGYDILSFDNKGNPKYIEVKTTRRHCHAPFYITANELLCSNEYATSFFLYRLFNYDSLTHSAEFYDRSGSLAVFCNNPVLFKAVTDGQEQC